MTRTRTFADKTMASYRLITILLFQFLVLGNLLLTFVSVFSPVDGFVVSKKWQPIEEAQNTLVFKSSARISNNEAGTLNYPRTSISQEFVYPSYPTIVHSPKEQVTVFNRVKRASGSTRGKSSRIQLATRPKTTTTTTTTSSTTTSKPTTSSSGEETKPSTENDYLAESAGGSGDDEYEDIEPSSSKTSAKTSGEKNSSRKTSSSEKSSTTTVDPNCETTTKKSAKSSGKSKGKSNKVKEQTTTSTTTTTTEEELEVEEEGEEEEETETEARTITTTTLSPVGTKKKPSKSTKKPFVEAEKSVTREESIVNDQKTTTKTDFESTTQPNKTSSELTVHKKKPLVRLPFIKPKNASVCTPEAYLEFPRDLIGNKWRGRGLVIIHICVACYMFYSLAVVCERYFMPSLEEFAQRLQLSEDVAGATLMSAGSSAPELFAALLGVFVAKGDVGTGTIVGSAVFNILFVIGICAFVSTTTAQLSWWPVLRDSVFYTITVLILILFIYDERITAFESSAMIAIYGLYIIVMAHNETIKSYVTNKLLSNPTTAGLISVSATIDAPDDVFGAPTGTQMSSIKSSPKVEEDAMYLAAMLVIVKHKRLFRSNLRFQSAGRYIIVKSQHKKQQQLQQGTTKQTDEVNYFGPENEPLNSSQRSRMEAYAASSSLSKNKFSIVSKHDYEIWNKPLEEGENYYLWLAKIPINYVLHYTVPDCTIYPDRYILAFIISILWTAFFSYIMVWMVTLIGYTFGIPDSVMGVTFLAAGTSVPDCYSSIHAARRGMADMAVSNSIGSNVFDILIGLSVPWFIQTAIYPGVVATINSRGIIYSVILLFVSLIVTIHLLNKYEWNLRPRLGLALLIAYGLFIVLTCMLEFNLFGHVNPPPCPVPIS